MKVFYQDSTLYNGRTNKQFCRGWLLKAEKGGIIKYPFQYSVVNVRDYEVTSTILPSTYIRPTETIRTSRLDMAFAVGDKVQLQDKRLMTVNGATYDYDDSRAMMNDGKTAWIITLVGGAGNGNTR